MKNIRAIAALLAAATLAACANNPPVPDWQMNAQSSIERSNAAYLSGNTRVEDAEYKRAREALASTGKVDLMIRAELIRCAARVASLVFEECSGFDKLSQDASPADRAYAAYLSGRATAADAPLLPAQHQPIAAASSDTAAASAAQAIADPLSKLVASGVLLRAGKATPQVLADATETASAQGWRRPLLAWLGVQSMRAEKAGDTTETARIQRRIELITGVAPPKIALVVVIKDKILVLGQELHTVGELNKLLADQKITEVRLRSDGSTDYEQIGRVIYGVAHQGIKLRMADKVD